ncbi:hypothetical protein ScPMuIL_001321 [Solemya velum]
MSKTNFITIGSFVLTILNLVTISSQTESDWLRKGLGESNKISLRDVDGQERKQLMFSDDSYFLDNRQDQVDPKQLGGIRIQNEAQKISAHLRWLSNEEIGVTKMQAIYDSLSYENKAKQEAKKLEEITSKLKKKWKNYIQVLRTNKVTVEHLYKFHAKEPVTHHLDCCKLPPTEFEKMESQYGCKVARHTSCDLIPYNIRRWTFNAGRNLTEVWRHNKQYFSSLKWQYFISKDGIHNEYPANSFQLLDNSYDIHCYDVHDIRHRDIYLSTMQSQRKHIVIVMDHGNSLSDNQLRTAKGITQHILGSLSEKDRVGVIGLASKATFPREDECLPRILVPATFEARTYFSQFFNNLEKQDVPTNHSLGFEQAFEMIENMLTRNRGRLIDEAMIIYISRGLLSSLTEAKDVMNTIASRNGLIQHRVIINTYAVIDDGKPIMYEKSFLQDIADQNFQKYDVQFRSSAPIMRGAMLAVNTTRDLSSTVGKFYIPLNKTTRDEYIFSLPYIDIADQGLTMSLSQPCFYKEVPFGVVGIDLNMEEVVEDITYYTQDEGSYAFIINTDGYTIMHPSFRRPSKTHLQPMHTDIWHFENVDGFERIRSDMINIDNGERTLKVNRKTGANDTTGSEGVFFAKYIWKKIENAPFIVVIKTIQEADETRELKDIYVQSQPEELMYHRLDLLPPDNMCLHMKQMATLGSSTVFLSAESFQKPYEHLSQEETKRMVQMYMAFLQDDTLLIMNPGLKDKIRNDVAATARINSEWIHHYQTSRLNDYLIRRYVATPGGLFRIYPGSLMDKNYDPTKRAWYDRAMKFPGHVTLTAPYLDVGGAGYISTISHTIFEGKPAALHHPADKAVAVMGMDVTLGYFYKLLVKNIPACNQKTIRCFMMDDEGYLIAHPALMEPNGKGPVEQQHITHKEPLVANDILYHRHFVQKKLCNRYNDRTVQRFYFFNTLLDGVLTNLVHGEHCARYQVTHIPGTNVFLGIVNYTCDTATAFCPCSMVDRLCLNCNRMEQSECECPCECPLHMNFCTGELLDEEDINPSCPRRSEHEQMVKENPLLVENLKQCYRPRCSDRKTKMNCLGVVNCEWCQIQHDGKTSLREPYCTDQRKCFGGVLGANTPYNDPIRDVDEEVEPVTIKSTPVGPVAGGIMGCFLVLALGVYCYRHHIHRNSHQYISTLPENQNRMSHYYDQDDPDQVEDPGAGHTNFVLATFDNPASISPYRVNTSYRRPAGGDSDHGYSTMTPHEDSEHASLPCLEPLIIGRDRYKPGHHSLSITKTQYFHPHRLRVGGVGVQLLHRQDYQGISPYPNKLVFHHRR